MVTCPRCNGEKTLMIETLTLTSEGREASVSVIKCITCQGAGIVTEAVRDQYVRMTEAWCQCGNPSKKSQYYADGEHPTCGKHCYTCWDCGKLLQVG